MYPFIRRSACISDMEGGSDVGNNASYSSSASTSSLAANSWHHVAATWHNDGSTTTLAIYLDGSLINTTTAGNLVLDGPTTFGISKGAFNSHYVLLGGSIAEMRVWNVARSESEIANNKDDIFVWFRDRINCLLAVG